ncbi:MAG: S8 family serine peptidase [Gemmatimonadaceae bacterium]|nr:S8 family serine peptidase [Gemmatimonadaceae bacterium]
MATIRYPAQGTQQSFSITRLSTVEQAAAPRPSRAAPGTSKAKRATAAAAAAPVAFDARSFVSAMRMSETMRMRIPTDDPKRLALVQPPSGPASASARPRYAGGMTIMTPSIIVEGARIDDIKAARNAGARIVDEGFDGKALLLVDSLADVTKICALLAKRQVGSVTPNFLRRYGHTPRSTAQAAWAHRKINLAAAWRITKGAKTVRIAILDEGVDTAHPALRTAVVAQRDFIGDKGNSAMPDGDDAHGTACAGVAVGRGTRAPGVAPRCSLIAARIAMDDGAGHWVFDDYATADAIDWCWRNDAAVLSNSWGGGVPSDAISRAFGRARTQGRGGKGAVVCIAAGNDQIAIDFPGELPGYVTVGASTPADERKTRRSSDGEGWWGSNFGETMWLLAPGVFIHTADISGARGYEPGNYTGTFNGTSSATPHVAGAVGLMLSANPGLTASAVRTILRETAVPLPGQSGWTKELGYGRLDVGKAVAAARRHR